MRDDRYGYTDHMNGGAWAMGLLMLIAIGLLIALLVVLLVRSTRAGAPAALGAAPPISGPTALQILDVRLARGEIDVAEYRDRRALLTNHT